MTDAPFTIAGSPDHVGRHELTFHTPKITGRAHIRAAMTTMPRSGEPVPGFFIELSPTLTGDNGRTVYRSADPEADEINTGQAVIRNPVRINGVAYRGTVHLAPTVDGQWRVEYSSIDRVGTITVHGSMSPAASRALRDLVTGPVAEAFMTPERISETTLAGKRRQIANAEKAVREAEQALTTRQQELSEAENELAKLI
jgi:hypothetical protein